MDFNELVSLLQDNGYNVKVETITNSDKLFAFVTGKSVEAGFCEPGSECYSQLNGTIAADNINCFNKWSQCPLKLPFPKDNEQATKLLSLLEYLGSKDGEEESNSFGYLDSNQYHY